MKHRTQSHSSPRDRGLTLIELVVSIGLIGLLIVPITAAISVVLRTSAVSTDVVTESNDLQQAVNYLPADARAGSSDPAAYKTSDDSDTGSGCSPTGSDNVLRIDDASTSSSRNVAYLLVSNGDGTARLDRLACLSDGTLLSSINIADELVDDGVTPAAASHLVVTEESDGDVVVERVDLILEQLSGSETVSAAPLAESAIPAAAIPTTDCADDLLAATQNFSTFTEADVHLNRGDTKRSSAIGGKLSWDGLATLGQNFQSGEYPTIVPSQTALYIQEIDWANSSGVLRVLSNGVDVVIADVTGLQISNDGKKVSQTGVTNGPYIEVLDGDASTPISAIDFADAFTQLRACSAALALLPNSCTSCAAQVQLWDQNNNAPYPGVGEAGGTNQVNVRLYPDRANVLNLTAAQLEGLGGSFVFSWQDGTSGSGSADLSATQPLIINVSDSGDIVLSKLNKVQNATLHVLYNFPNADSVTVNGQPAWGTILAPQSHIEVNAQFQGGIIAKSWVNNNKEVNTGRLFDGTIDWDA